MKPRLTNQSFVLIITEKLDNFPTFIILVTAVAQGIQAGIFQTTETQTRESIAYGAWSLVHGISMLRITLLQTYKADFETADHASL